MRPFAPPVKRWVYPIAAILLYAAVLLRGVIFYRNSPYLIWMVGILLIWLVLAVTSRTLSHKISGYFPVYLTIQTILVFVLLFLPDSPDFFATLLMILSLQTLMYYDLKIGVLWIAACTLAIALIFYRTVQMEALGLAMVYCAGMILLGFYALATRRALDARLQNQKLVQQLRDANAELAIYSTQMEQLGAAHERNRLARELHDSVTQTVFSMSMNAQSAGLLLDRNSSQVKEQLERLGQQTQSALAEIKLLVSELQPAEIGGEGLTAALRRFVEGRVFPGGLTVSLHSEGDLLNPGEVQALLRIIQEALNNAARHARISQATVILHLLEPFWIEVEDKGQGFDIKQALEGNRVGLKSMQERAAEIGWNLIIRSSPGSGTKVRLEKTIPRELKND
jgi:signal transduction histidine kinase